MAAKGFKQTPFQGYHIGRAPSEPRALEAKVPKRRLVSLVTGSCNPCCWFLMMAARRRAVSSFQPRTDKTVGEAGDFFGAQFWGGMYHNRYVLENGTWKIRELTLDEPYITPVAGKNGVWAKSKDPAEPRVYRNTANVDIALASLGKREEHLPGGMGEGWQWPTILPMWFTYTNPVSGRVPELHQPDCVPCADHPELRLD